jgi:hypothetical protein
MNNDVIGILVGLAILVVWFALMKLVLPRLGVPT